MLKSNWCNCSDECILVNRTIVVEDVAADRSKNNIQVLFKNCTAFLMCASGIKNTQIDNAKNIEIRMPVYNLMEYSGMYSKNLNIYGNALETKQLCLTLALLIIILVIAFWLSLSKI